MSYFISTHESVDPLANATVAASVFQAGRPRLTEDEMYTRDTPILTAYGSTREAALLSLRSALQSAVGATEMEIHTLRKNRMQVITPAQFVSALLDNEDDDEDQEDTTADGIVVEDYTDEDNDDSGD
jgi:hypothetical protein